VTSSIRRCVALGWLLLAAVLWPTAPASADVTPIELGSFGGIGQALAINERGQVVGWSVDTSLTSHAFLWQDGSMHDLGIPSSMAQDINNSGAIVGHMQVAGSDHAFLWKSGTTVDLGTLGGLISRARAINASGQVVGESSTSSGQVHAFLWEAGQMRDLGTLPGAATCWASAINQRGQVVGACDTDTGRRAFLWERGVMTDIGTLGGSFAEADEVNARTQIVGGSTATTVPGLAFFRAFLLERDEMTDLGSLGGPYAHAFAINDRGQVVGEASLSSGVTVAFLWEAGTMTHLGPRDEFSAALDVNNRGMVVGFVGISDRMRPALWQSTV
jgi:probable HAF family extracellular repeat protein